MSSKSQERNMRQLAALLSQDLGYVFGEKESGPNGAKRSFLNVGKRFLRDLARDLGLQNVQVTSNAAGIGVSGECCLMGMWENGGICVVLTQMHCAEERVMCYRTIRNMKDHKGGRNVFLARRELEKLTYEQLLKKFSALRKEGTAYGRAV